MTTTRTTKTLEQGKRRAAKASLFYVNNFDQGITRRRCGRGFTYISPTGRTIKTKGIRERIETLVIPPAWQDVWVCSKPNGHIQARGVDEAGRMQYLYHEKWQAVSSITKFDRMQLFAEVLPRIRRRVRQDLNQKSLTQYRVQAAIVRLLDKAQIRIGDESYLEESDSRGATTLDSDHVDIENFLISLDFPGKSGQRQQIEFSDRKVAEVIELCEELNGQFLFCYQNEEGNDCSVTSSNVNSYLREISDEDITAKDFRTWWSNVAALDTLKDMKADATQTQRSKMIVSAVKSAAELLGNTPAVCRKSYIHPLMTAAAESGELVKMLKKTRGKSGSIAELTVAEIRFANLLSQLEFE